MVMDEIKRTHDILKYGQMYPDKVRDIITTYMEDRDINGYYTEWEVYKVANTSDSEVMDTHFFKVWVYHDDGYQQVLFGLIPKHLDELPKTSRWAQVGQGIICVDVTNKDTDEVYSLFNEYYEELYQVCLMEEYDRNFPEGGYSHDL